MSEPFDPSKYLTKVSGKDYLEVKWRLVWLRDQEPNASIETELVAHDAQRKHAIFKATVTLPTGGSATGYGSEDEGGFREYLEKAETKAIGRALAALGFGTQFSAFEFGGEAEANRPVDSPVGHGVAYDNMQNRGNGNTVTPQQHQQTHVVARDNERAGIGIYQPLDTNAKGQDSLSDAQLKFLGDLFAKHQIDDAQVLHWIENKNQVPGPAYLGKQQAREWIDFLKATPVGQLGS